MYKIWKLKRRRKSIEWEMMGENNDDRANAGKIIETTGGTVKREDPT